jgi:TPR repeat protein
MPLGLKQRMRLFFRGIKTNLAKARFFESGRGVEQNFLLAEEFYRAAMHQGEMGSKFQWALFLTRRGRDQEAVSAYFKAFKSGDLCARAGLEALSERQVLDSDFYLAQIYERQRQFPFALLAYQRAINLGVARAFYPLGKLQHQLGDEVASEIAYREGAKRGELNCLKELRALSDSRSSAARCFAEVCEERFPEEVLQAYTKAITLGDKLSLLRLARIYRDGEYAVPVNVSLASQYYDRALVEKLDEAFLELRQLAHSGNLEASFYLANHDWRKGEFLAAAEAWILCAEKGHEPSKKALMSRDASAEILINIAQRASISLKNMSFALFFYEKAVQKNQALGEPVFRAFLTRMRDESPELQFALGMGYEKQGRMREALEFYVLSAESGEEKAILRLKRRDFHPTLLKSLADQYRHGDGVGLNVAFAIQCYEAAIAKGDAESAFLLAEFYESQHEFLGDSHLNAYLYYQKALELRNASAIDPISRLKKLHTHLPVSTERVMEKFIIGGPGNAYQTARLEALRVGRGKPTSARFEVDWGGLCSEGGDK